VHVCAHVSPSVGVRVFVLQSEEVVAQHSRLGPIHFAGVPHLAMR